MELQPSHFKGIFSDLFGWGRKADKPEESEHAPEDRADLGGESLAPPAAPPASSPANPVGSGAPVGPGAAGSAPVASSSGSSAPAGPAAPGPAPAQPGVPVTLTPGIVSALVGGSDFSGHLGELWNRPLADVIGNDYPETYGTPQVSRDGSLAYFASEKSLFAMSTESGANRWTFDADGKGLRSAPLVGPDGTLYVCGGDGNVHALDPAFGTKVWSAPAPAGRLAMGPDGSLVVTDGGTTALDPQTGATRWSSPIGGSDSTPGLDGRIFRAGDGERACAAYDRDTGNELWRFSRDGGLIRSRPTVGPDGTVYVGDTNGGFYALDPATGQPKWEARAKAYVLYPSSLSADGSTVYVGSSDHNLYAFDAATGRQKWRQDVGAEVRMQPFVTPDGCLSLASDRNQVFLLDEKTGLPLAKAPAASYVHVAPQAANGHLVLYANNHTLYGYSAPLSREALMEKAMSEKGAAPASEISVGQAAVRIGGVEIPIRRE